MEWTTGESVENKGGNFLSAPGTYHMAIKSVDETVTKKNGELIQNAAFRVNCEVITGTDTGQKGKTKDIIFFHPKSTDNDGGDLARRKIDRMLLATNLMKLDAVGGKTLKLDLNDMNGQQFVAKFQQDKRNPEYVELAFSDIFHVDDPAVADIPKDKEWLKLIPNEYQWPGGKMPGADEAAAASSPAGGAAKPDYTDVDI